MTIEYLNPDNPIGWVIASTTTSTRTGKPHTSFWYGDGHGWGMTWGPLTERSTPGGRRYSIIATYPTRRAAESAFRSIRPLRASRNERAMRAVDALEMVRT